MRRLIVTKKALREFFELSLHEDLGGFRYTSSEDLTLGEDPEDPIKPIPQMSVQLSEDEPPIDDPDYIPGNVVELSNAASVISKEVPDDQINFYYRALHKLLDMALDKSQTYVPEKSKSDAPTKSMLESAIRNIILENNRIRDRLISKGKDQISQGADIDDVVSKLLSHGFFISRAIPESEIRSLLGGSAEEASVSTDSEQVVQSQSMTGVSPSGKRYISRKKEKSQPEFKISSTSSIGHYDEDEEDPYQGPEQDWLEMEGDIVSERDPVKDLVETIGKYTHKIYMDYKNAQIERFMSAYGKNEERTASAKRTLKSLKSLPIFGAVMLSKDAAEPEKDREYAARKLIEMLSKTSYNNSFNSLAKELGISFDDARDRVLKVYLVSQETQEVDPEARPSYMRADPSRAGRKEKIKSEEEIELELKNQVIDYMQKINNMGKKYDFMAPFWGFSGASGIRQWLMKHVENKFKKLLGAATGRERRPAKEFLNLFGDTIEMIAERMTEIAPDVLKKLQLQQSKAGSPGSEKRQIVDRKIKVLMQAINQMDRLSGLFAVQGVFDKRTTENEEIYEEISKLLQSAGGGLIRIANQELVYKDMFNQIMKDWEEAMKEVLQTSYNLDPKQAASFSQFFTGKKNVPDFEAMKATAKKFIQVGISAEDFEDIMKIAQRWFDNAIKNEMSSRGKYGKPAGKKLNVNDAKIEKLIDTAIEEYFKTIEGSLADKSIRDRALTAYADEPDSIPEELKETILKFMRI